MVIPCYNSAAIICKTLSCLCKQNVSKTILWEVILVDNCCTDDTVHIARKTWPHSHPIPLRIVTEAMPGLSHARIKGFKTARYEFVSFIDDDNFVSDNWVQLTYETMIKNAAIGACGGISKPMFETAPPIWFDRSFWTAFTVGPPNFKQGDITKSRGHLWGAGSVIRKSAWQMLRSHGFQYQLLGRCGKKLTSGEDIELFYALRMAGWQLWQEPGLFFYHFISKNRLNWKYLLRVHVGFGASAPVLYIYRYFLYGEQSVPIHSWLRFFLKTLKKYLAIQAMFIRKPFTKKRGSELWLRLAIEKGKVLELWHIRKDFNRIFKNVALLYTQLNKTKYKQVTHSSPVLKNRK